MTDVFVRGVRDSSMTVPFPSSTDRFRDNGELYLRAAFRPSLPSRSQIMTLRMGKLQRLRTRETITLANMIRYICLPHGRLCRLARRNIAAFVVAFEKWMFTQAQGKRCPDRTVRA